MGDDFKVDPNVHTSSEDGEGKVREGERRHAKDLIVRAGTMVKPYGADYLGSAVIHYYRDKLDIGMTRAKLVSQLLVGNVPEGLAAQGGNQLYRDLMRAYGVKEPRKMQ